MNKQRYYREGYPRGFRLIAVIASALLIAPAVVVVLTSFNSASYLSFPLKGNESYRPYVGDRMLRRELENEDVLDDKPAYTVIGGEETELLTEESADVDDEVDNEE